MLVRNRKTPDSAAATEKQAATSSSSRRAKSKLLHKEMSKDASEDMKSSSVSRSGSKNVKSDLRLNALIGGKYHVIKRLGSGSFGDIFIGEVLNDENRTKVAIKFENASDRSAQLNNEIKLYKIIGEDTIGFPKIYYFGQWGENRCNVLVMDLLGKTLEDVFELCNQDFTLKTIIQIVIQLLIRFEYLHSKFIIYRDVKPENFLLGRPGTANQNIIHIVDFGLSREYIDPYTRRHIAYREGRSLTGTARYMSINTHNGIEQSRRDDLESLANLFTYLLRKGKLPWSGLKAATIKDRYRKIGELKQTIPVDVLLEGHPTEFQELLIYTRSLKFDENPDYTWCKAIFMNLMLKMEFEDDGRFDWDGKYK